MNAYLLLLACMGLGLVSARYWHMPDNAPAVLNAWVMRIALPALILVQIPRLTPGLDMLLPALGPWWLAVGSLVLIPLLGRMLGWTRGTVGCMILTCGMGNTSFIGLPLIMALRGDEAIGAAVIADQLGSFLALSLIGGVVVTVYAGQRPQLSDILGKLLRFPPFCALPVAGLVLAAGGWPPAVDALLSRLADTLTPVTLFVVGLQFRAGDIRHHGRELILGLGWKMGLAPAGVVLAIWLWGDDSLAGKVTVLQTAMAPMITSGILAQQSGLAPRLANTMVSVGTLVSLVSVPLWSLLLG